MPQPEPIENTWGPAELARYLGYAESTVIRMASCEPEKLPPRISGMPRHPRWVPEVCRSWAIKRSDRAEQVKKPRGRPRKVVMA